MHAISRLLDQHWSNLDSFGRIGSELDRFLSGFDEATTRTPPLNISQNAHEVRVSLELPGVEVSAVDVTVQDRVLTITGPHRNSDHLPEDAAWILREHRNDGRFERKVNLPWEVESEQVKASYQQGILTVHLPRAEKDKPRKIDISQQ